MSPDVATQEPEELSRRRFLAVSAGATGSLLVSLYLDRGVVAQTPAPDAATYPPAGVVLEPYRCNCSDLDENTTVSRSDNPGKQNSRALASPAVVGCFS